VCRIFACGSCLESCSTENFFAVDSQGRSEGGRKGREKVRCCVRDLRVRKMELGAGLQSSLSGCRSVCFLQLLINACGFCCCCCCFAS